MAYGELVKNFDRIRAYMRAFYVYGFKLRGEYDLGSVRGYDNERRRIESWLGDYMSFRRTAEGKRVFLSVDGRRLNHNPLHRAFRAKSFTRNDILLHFCLLDALTGCEALTARELAERVDAYLAQTGSQVLPDESTVRAKVEEYLRLGLLVARPDGRALRYALPPPFPTLPAWSDAIAFYAEADCLGVVGSYLMNRLTSPPDWFRFKHHDFLRALEGELLLAALTAIREHRNVRLLAGGPGEAERSWTATPIVVLAGTQTGRYYLCAFDHGRRRLNLCRLDRLRAVVPLEPEPRFSEYAAMFNEVRRHIWGAGTAPGGTVHTVAMTIRADEEEDYVVRRLLRERRSGEVARLDATHWRFTASVYDPYELLPWVRTFIGRVVRFDCDDRRVVERFQQDLRAMRAMYGGDDAV